ncbi:MAG TPA: roadblock/LC7 domain-containing protein [Verrucomicrobiae bacterium]|nr:roadblock/LC7 domain-containing protein [Verrucomicrobiae bacterium]
MFTLPELLSEDVQQFNETLTELLFQTEATTALIMDKGGFLITHQGDAQQFDLTTIAALSSGAFMANQTIASLVRETNFNSVHQEGEKLSLFAVNIDEHCLLLIVFKPEAGVGAVKYYAMPAAEKIASQIKVARLRNPNGGVDLSVLNLANSASIFQKGTTARA